MSVVDASELAISAALTTEALNAIAANVIHAHHQWLWKVVFRKLIGAERLVHGEQASGALETAIHALEQRIRARATRYSSLHWLWMLRRVPAFVFEGSLKTTLGYDWALAEALTSEAPQRPGTARHTDGFISYALPRATIENLAVLCVSARYLASLHAVYRWAGKGARINVSPIKGAIPEPDTALRQSVELYDSRVERHAGPFGRLGTFPAKGSNTVLRVTRTVDYAVSMSRDALGEAIPEREPLEPETIVARFHPELVDLEDLTKLGVSGKNEIAALFILMTGALYLNRHRSKYHSLLTRGYLVFRRDVLLLHIRDALEMVEAPLKSVLEELKLCTAESILSELSTIRKSTWPVLTGSSIRQDGEIVCLDLFAATNHLHAAEALAGTGPFANERAAHFELAVQRVIDSSPWRPSLKRTCSPPPVVTV